VEAEDEDLTACSREVADVSTDMLTIPGKTPQGKEELEQAGPSSYISSQADLDLPDRFGGSALFNLTAPYLASYLL
jgi:hypothetical protein